MEFLLVVTVVMKRKIPTKPRLSPAKPCLAALSLEIFIN